MSVPFHELLLDYFFLNIYQVVWKIKFYLILKGMYNVLKPAIQKDKILSVVFITMLNKAKILSLAVSQNR